MKTKFLILFLIIANISLFAQTTIHNGQKVSGKWTKSGSPYIVEGEAIVPDGKTLTIKPGVEVQFKTGENIDYRYDDGDLNPNFDVGCLRIEGKLIAKGKKTKMILFTNKGKYNNWGNIFFVNSKDNYMEYCHVEYAQYLRLVTEDDNATGAISFVHSGGTIKNCIVSSSWTGINCKQESMPEIINCVVTNNEYGIEANSDSKPNVINTIVWDNAESFYVNPGAAIKISYSLIQDDYLIEGLYDKGNNVFDKNPKMDNNFSIKESSPCYKTGEKGVNIGILR
jgi:hypothetical protein